MFNDIWYKEDEFAKIKNYLKKKKISNLNFRFRVSKV